MFNLPVLFLSVLVTISAVTARFLTLGFYIGKSGAGEPDRGPILGALLLASLWQVTTVFIAFLLIYAIRTYCLNNRNYKTIIIFSIVPILGMLTSVIFFVHIGCKVPLPFVVDLQCADEVMKPIWAEWEKHNYGG